MWQDIALSIIGCLFTVMLVPQLMDAWRGKAIMNFWTCLVTGAGCIAVGVVDVTLHLQIASGVSVATGSMWLLLMYYSEKNREKELRTEREHAMNGIGGDM